MRVPGFFLSRVGRNSTFSSGSRNKVITVALEKSLWKISAFSNVALPATPSFAALRSESLTIDLSLFHDKISLIPDPSPGGRREVSSLSLRERDRG
jgi:hypothetical protein